MDEGKGYQVVWSLYAQNSLKATVDYISLDSPFQARRIANEIQDLGNSLDRNPWVYQECVELPTKNHIYRKATYADTYKIIYKIVGSEIWILDIFHGKRNPAQLKKLRRIKP